MNAVMVLIVLAASGAMTTTTVDFASMEKCRQAEELIDLRFVDSALIHPEAYTVCAPNGTSK